MEVFNFSSLAIVSKFSAIAVCVMRLKFFMLSINLGKFSCISLYVIEFFFSSFTYMFSRLVLNPLKYVVNLLNLEIIDCASVFPVVSSHWGINCVISSLPKSCFSFVRSSVLSFLRNSLCNAESFLSRPLESLLV